MGNQHGINQSLYDWCMYNNRQDILDRWDYKLNKYTPIEIGFGSNKKFYFKCPKEYHISELKSINTITSHNQRIICQKCNSFAQYHINNTDVNFLEKYWDYEKNIISPWDIVPTAKMFVWIKCSNVKYHESYYVHCSNFTIGGTRCPYCKGKKTHPKDSFAQWGIDNICEDFLEKYWSNKNILNPFNIPKSTHKQIWIKCQKKDYHESYIPADSFIRGVRCSYCGNHNVHKLDSLGSLFPKSIFLWSDKNKKSPYEYTPKSNQKVWWKCPEGKHEDYFRTINTSNKCNFRCPECINERNESLLQEKVRTYIEEKYYKYKLNHEHKCTIVPCNPKYNGSQGAMPFDNEIVNLKLIIEVNGEQHYNYKAYSGIWGNKNLTPEQQLHKRKLYDRYKKFIAYCNGYFYLEIPYWTDNKNEDWKKLIDNKINEILKLKGVM